MKARELFEASFDGVCEHFDLRIHKLEERLKERDSLINMVQFCVDNEEFETISNLFAEDLETVYETQDKLRHSTRYTAWCVGNVTKSFAKTKEVYHD